MDGKRTSISRKLFAAMAIPVLFVALMAGSRVVTARSDRNRVAGQVDLALATSGPASVLSTILNERDVTALEMVGLAGAVQISGAKNSADARAKVTKAMAEFQKFLDGSGKQVRDLYTPPFEAAKIDLDVARKRVDEDTLPRDLSNKQAFAYADVVYGQYTAIGEGFLDANRKTVTGIDDAVLRNRATTITDQTLITDSFSQISRATAFGQFAPDPAANTRATAVLFAKYQDARAESIAALEGDKKNQDVLKGYFNRPAFQPFDTNVKAFLAGKPADPNAIIAAAATNAKPDSDAVSSAIRGSLKSRADALTGAASSSLWRSIALLFVSAGISVIVAYLMARTISKPLLSLAEQAHVMSSKLLPEAVHGVLATPIGREIVEPKLDPITVNSRDEVADVALALTGVQDRALSLAVEQAALRHNFSDAFVNLGRRMQGLILRQLEFITDLEDAETNDANLSNLFKLDHIATRIRRNAESLIVLGGNEKRSAGRMPPMEAIDTVRAALSEVEDYQRITIGEFADVRLPGDVATDLSHILAELLENGLMFSPPDCDVEVTGHIESTGYLFTVLDRGIGMSPEAIDKANVRLAAKESFSVAPSRYLGHYIAGHLAARVGVQIKLQARPGGGTAAAVFVPQKLLAAQVKVDTSQTSV